MPGLRSPDQQIAEVQSPAEKPQGGSVIEQPKLPIDQVSETITTETRPEEPQKERVEFLKRERKDPLELIKSYFQSTSLVALGENHNSPAMENFVRNSLSKLKSAGLTDLVLEEYDSYQGEVDQFLQTGQMSDALSDYLTHGFIRNDANHNLRVRLLEEARKLGLRVHFIDPGNVPDREQYLANKLIPVLNEEGKRILMLYGNLHAAKTSLPSAGGTMVLGRLNDLYPGDIKSVMRISDKRYGSPLGRKIIDDSNAAELNNTSFAIELKNSPYAQDPILPHPTASPKVGESYDALIYHSGDVVLPHPTQV